MGRDEVAAGKRSAFHSDLWTRFTSVWTLLITLRAFVQSLVERHDPYPFLVFASLSRAALR